MFQRIHFTLLNRIIFESRRSLNKFSLKGIHEPKYLDYLKPSIPYYELINIQIKAYDYALLESYASYIHKLSNRVGLSVTKFWCVSNQTFKIETLENESSVVDQTYELNLYERNLQIENISSKVMSLLVESLHRSLPAGIFLSIHQHDHESHEKNRYIPDLELVQHKTNLKLLLSSAKNDEIEEDVKKKK
ncbi:39S ribosomal protein L48 [Sarcoptes scabiei]|uniref:39S ribosomal protein L48, mitochondrial n=1 Tax=Sarcoptes scabiei TaxID=52283 RepID=A0A834RHH4_SARSC|nr:39S ribosomal protein L48 [Sarcoptes scabiei]